ncbi:MAG: type II toxin-antitoxin system YafQ family toxin [Ruminococcus sp.]|jgi:mRNA interferase YafQ|nr:type II toxin-antitoxin system YafQ family toxin [Ruminococcus sp.]
MYTLEQTKQFKRDLKRLAKQKKDMSKLEKVIDMLSEGKPLPPEYEDHPLNGQFRKDRECHIEPDWILIYQIKKKEMILKMIQTGTHTKTLKM